MNSLGFSKKPEEALARDVLVLKDCNWLSGIPPHPSAQRTGEGAFNIELKFRSMMTPVKARLQGMKIYLESSQVGISPGQAAVCYQGGRLVGGGWIADTACENESLAA
jgi:tRNA-specific 2-thiouridylase